ncbi:MAG: hypothetical protein V4725_01365 [Bacteroidota bacterium]
MLKRFPFTWLIFSIPVALGFASFPLDKKVSETSTSSTSYRRLNPIACAPFAYVPEDYLQLKIDEKKGIGQINFPITTNSKDAQLFFNQGMAFLWSFEYVQAARSLYTAATFDSLNPMMYWGLSQAYESMNDTTESRNMANKAMALSTQASDREKYFINLQQAASRPAYDSTAVQQLRGEVSSMMDKANEQFPADPQMWMYTGILRLFTDFKGPEGETYAQKCRAAMDNYLSKTLAISPDHFGAFHFLIHMNEGASDFKKALYYGNLYTQSSPEIPHAWHMYAHDLMKTGQVSEAIEKFNHAFALEKKKYQSEQMPAHYDWHHQHNMELLAYCHQYKGQFKQAEEIFSRLDTLRAFRPAMEGRIRKGHPYFYLQNNQPEKAILLAKRLSNSPEATNQYMGNFIEGLAQVFQKNDGTAMEHYNKMIHIVDSMKESDVRQGMRQADANEAYNYMYARAGIVAMGAGLVKDAYDTTMLKKMKAVQGTLLKQTGPDPWIDALYFLQMLTQLSLQTGNLKLAEISANNMVLHDPEYPGSYWLLARIKKMQGDAAGSAANLEKAKLGYKDADKDFIARLIP